MFITVNATNQIFSDGHTTVLCNTAVAAVQQQVWDCCDIWVRDLGLSLNQCEY